MSTSLSAELAEDGPFCTWHNAIIAKLLMNITSLRVKWRTKSKRRLSKGQMPSLMTLKTLLSKRITRITNLFKMYRKWNLSPETIKIRSLQSFKIKDLKNLLTRWLSLNKHQSMNCNKRLKLFKISKKKLRQSIKSKSRRCFGNVQTASISQNLNRNANVVQFQLLLMTLSL